MYVVILIFQGYRYQDHFIILMYTIQFCDFQILFSRLYKWFKIEHWDVDVSLLYNIHTYINIYIYIYHIEKRNTSIHTRVTFILLFNSLHVCAQYSVVKSNIGR